MYTTDTVSLRTKRMSRSLDKKWDLKFEDKTDELPFNTVVMFLGIIGTMPFTWKTPHYPSLHPTKSTLALAVAEFTIVLASSYSMLRFYIKRLTTKEFQLDEKLLYFQCIGISLAASITMAVWSDLQAARRGMKIWFRINRLYFKITSRKMLPLCSTTLDTLIVAITVLYSTATYFAAKFAFPDLNMSYIFAPCCIHTMTVFCLMCTLWIGYFAYLLGIAEVMNKELLLNIKRNALTTYKLQYHEEMWLQIRTLADALGTFNSPVVITACSAGTIINCIYLFIVYARIGKYFQSLAPLMIAASFLMLITLMIIASHSATDQMKLLRSGILDKHKFTPVQATLRRQVMYMYFVERMRSPTPTFGNFIVVNKSLLISLFGTIAMHLVVMVQLTQPKKSHNKSNAH